MTTIKIIIERSLDMYSAYSENVEGIYGGGDTVEEAKKSIFEAIEISKELPNTPEILKGEYNITFKFDTQSFLNHYKGILTNSGLEKITGINQRQLYHYASGTSKPRPEQRTKILNGLHKLGKELMQLEL